MEENTIQEQPRRRGNPNWVKGEPRKPAEKPTNVNNPFSGQPPDSSVWLVLFSAILPEGAGPSSIAQAARHADFALEEYKTRFGQ